MTALRSLNLYALNIPFNVTFQHSTQDRDHGASVVVRIESESGHVGYGEGAPRSYVTGETVDSCFRHLSGVLWPAILEASLPGGDDGDLLARIDAILPDPPPAEGVVANHSARCAMELALMDLLLKEAGRSLADLLPPVSTGVQYSGIISGGSQEKALTHVAFMKSFGFPDVKVKVGGPDTRERLQLLREALGPEMGLRIDANEAWEPDEAIEVLRSLSGLGVQSAEQPVNRNQTDALPRIRKEGGVPIMVDESLVTTEDTLSLIAADACDYFNLRLSKCGGIWRTLWMAERAREAGVGLQLGSHVGESAILSAAALHVAAYMPDVRWVEGGWGPILLTEDVSQERLGFGQGGVGQLLTSPGLGIEVLDHRLEAHSVQSLTLLAESGGQT